jgi:hypothetical protein
VRGKFPGTVRRTAVVFRAAGRAAGVLFRIAAKIALPLVIADVLTSDSVEEAAGKAGRFAAGYALGEAGAALCAPGGPLAAGACGIAGAFAGMFGPEVIKPIDPKVFSQLLHGRTEASGQH